jgi:hypothetical protein
MMSPESISKLLMKVSLPVVLVLLVCSAGCASRNANISNSPVVQSQRTRTPPPLKLVKAEITKVSGSAVLGLEDTNVTITIKYLGTLSDEEKAKLQWVWQEPILVDETGQNYTQSYWKGDHSFFEPWGKDTYLRVFRLNLSRVPAKVKKLTLKASLSVNGSLPLPISVVVLNRHSNPVQR